MKKIDLPIRFGILGCGSFVQRRILPYLHEIEEIKVTCIQKRDLEEAKKVASRYQIPYAVSTRTELLNNPEVDAVLIATQNHLHEEDALACAESGKPTLCEKPLAPTAAAAERMVKAFQDRSLPFFVGHSLRFKPSILKAKEHLAKGAMGELLRLHAFFSITVPKESWKRKKECGGGVLQDIGIHLIDLIHFLSGQKISSIYADMRIKDVDETVLAECRLEKGGIASFTCSFEEPPSSGFEIIGTKSRMISTNSLRQTFDPIESLYEIKEDDSTLFYPLKASNIYLEELKHVALCLQQKKSSWIDAAIGVQNQKILEAAYQAFFQKKIVSLI